MIKCTLPSLGILSAVGGPLMLNSRLVELAVVGLVAGSLTVVTLSTCATVMLFTDGLSVVSFDLGYATV